MNYKIMNWQKRSKISKATSLVSNRMNETQKKLIRRKIKMHIGATVSHNCDRVIFKSIHYGNRRKHQKGICHLLK